VGRPLGVRTPYGRAFCLPPQHADTSHCACLLAALQQLDAAVPKHHSSARPLLVQLLRRPGGVPLRQVLLQLLAWMGDDAGGSTRLKGSQAWIASGILDALITFVGEPRWSPATAAGAAPGSSSSSPCKAAP
jgi:hypothetical protein